MTNDHCTVCPNSCHWSVHSNIPYEYYEELEYQTTTSDELFKRYTTAQSEKSKQEQILEGLSNDLARAEKQSLDLLSCIRECINKLHTIALIPTTYETNAEYIDKLIISEESTKRPGYKERVEALLKLRDQANIVQSALDLGI